MGILERFGDEKPPTRKSSTGVCTLWGILVKVFEVLVKCRNLGKPISKLTYVNTEHNTSLHVSNNMIQCNFSQDKANYVNMLRILKEEFVKHLYRQRKCLFSVVSMIQLVNVQYPSFRVCWLRFKWLDDIRFERCWMYKQKDGMAGTADFIAST